MTQHTAARSQPDMIEFEARVATLRQTHPDSRIQSFEFAGHKYWLKQPERLAGAMKLLKDDPRRALQTEIQVLTGLAGKGAPVPRVMLSGDDFFVVEDAGKTVSSWLHASKSDSSVPFMDVLNDSAKALADLHALGLSHGRPALRDIGWQQGNVKFIDFEAAQQSRPLRYQQQRDLLVYLHSLYRYMGTEHAQIDAAIASYRRSGGEQNWLETQQRMRRWQWLRPLLKPLRNIGGKDLKPVYWVLWHFQRHR
ncbi:serine/threonine protein phosphatase [Shewanella sp.]|uniref:serine/threonine protein phosphatase n=1 Tax=Shewanella sp. TaxID=50422 RepID=UPI003561B4C9